MNLIKDTHKYINSCINLSKTRFIEIYAFNFTRPYCRHHKYLLTSQSQILINRNCKFLSIPILQTRWVSDVKPNLTESILKTKLSNLSEKPDLDLKDKSEASTKNSWFSAKNSWKYGLLFLTLSGLLSSGAFILIYGKPQIDKDQNEIIDEFTILPVWKAYLKRSSKELLNFKKMIQEPYCQKLLPDPLKDPWYQPPYTLVLEMTDVLVHPDWTLGTGWRFKKRPALDYFLQQVCPPLFEVVVYTHEMGLTANPLIESLDPNGLIMFKLFRDSTRYMDGTHVKDLACLNRDLSKVIIVDCDAKAISLQPQNAFLLKRWDGDDADRNLVDLAAFLRTIATNNVEDVRTVLEYYSQFDDPIATFKEKQYLLKQLQEEKVNSGKSASGQKTFGLSFGSFGKKT